MEKLFGAVLVAIIVAGLLLGTAFLGPPASTLTEKLTKTYVSTDTLTTTYFSTTASNALARQFQLLGGYVAERIFTPPLPDLNGIVRSRSGIVYLQHIGLSSGISTLDSSTGNVARIFDLPQEGVSPLVGGPDDTAFIGVHGEIWQVHPDGSHTIWGRQGDGVPRYYAPNDRLLGTSHDRKLVVELRPDSAPLEIASGFTDICDIVAAPDGTIFVTDWETGDVTRIDPDGDQRVLVNRVLIRDPMDMEIDPAGRLFLNTVVSGFVRVDMNSGALTRYDSAWSPCTNHPADFIFTGAGRVLFMDPTLSQVTWADLNTGESGLLVSNGDSNTYAADIGPDDVLYIGTWGCDELPAQVIRIGDDGRREVYVDGLRGGVRDIAFAADGSLYIATMEQGRGASLYYVSPGAGTLTEIPGVAGLNIISLSVDPASGHLLASAGGYGNTYSDILEFTRSGLLARHPVRPRKGGCWDFQIDNAPDGTLYAYCSEGARAQKGPVIERWILRLDLASGESEIVAQYDFQGCCVMGNLAVGPDGTIWWVVNPEFEIYRISPNGEMTLFARNLPIDPAAVAVDDDGDVYFTSPSGIYRIYLGP